MTGLQIQRLSLFKYKPLIASTMVFALLALPTYAIIPGRVAHASAGVTRYASATGADNANDCNDVNNPCTLEGALAAATTDDTVQLRSDFVLSHKVLVSKAVTVDGNNKTVTAAFDTYGNNNALFELQAAAIIKNISLNGQHRNIHGINAWHTGVNEATVWDTQLKNFGKSGLNVGEQARVVAGNLTTSGNGWHAIDVDKTGSWLKLAGSNSFSEGSKIPVLYVDNRNVGQVVIDIPSLYSYIDDTHHLVDPTQDRVGDRAYFLAVAAPVLVSPTDESVVAGTSLTNSWNPVDGADHYVYESYNDAAVTSLRFRGNFTTTSKTAANVADTTFWWRVKAVNSMGLASAWSPLYKVTIDSTKPQQLFYLALYNQEIQ